MPTAAMMLSGVPAGGGIAGSSPMTVTIDHTKAGTADTSNYVLLFSSTKLSFRSVANGGSVGNVNDFRFAADSGGVTLLNWKIIQWNATTGLLVAKVLVSTLSHTSDTVQYLLYDGTSRGSFLGGASSALWDSNFKTVLNFGDGTTLDLTDETSNANNGTNHNTAVAASGPNGLGSVSFTKASSQYISTVNTINIAHVTIEAWVFLPSTPAGSPGSIVGISEGNGGGTTDKDLFVDTLGAAGWYAVITGSQVTRVTANATATTGAWHYLVGVADGTNSILYFDGAVGQTGAASGNTFMGYAAAGLQVSGVLNGNPSSTYATLSIAEVRLSDTARSASYVTATWNNINAPSTFYALS